MNRSYREAIIGTTQTVLFEEAEGDFYVGHAPNYVKVYARGESLHNELRNVEITELHKEGVLGKILE